MSEIIQDRQVFSLLEVARSIQKTISDRYKSSYWIKAEMIRLNHYKHSGHCYPDLVEKRNGTVIAQMRANLWKKDYERISKKFLETLKEPLKDGIKILFLAKISFEPVHGISLRILDIDAGYTLGDLEKEKQAIIERLRKEGIFDRNKRVKMPLLPQRIAVISVETSKGYSDFQKKIADNPWNFRFFHFLFPSVLQGDHAVAAIIAQLKRIKKVVNRFDIAAIVRGGGGDVGLSCYNDYRLAREVALFPIPVLTGIGHSTNETIVEMVAYRNAITPTDLADYLIHRFHEFLLLVQKSARTVRESALRMAAEERRKLQAEVKLLNSAARNVSIKNSAELKACMERMTQHGRFICRDENQNIRQARMALERAATKLIANNRMLAGQHARLIVREAYFFLRDNAQRLTAAQSNLSAKSLAMIRENHAALVNAGRNVDNMDPKNVLKRGFSISLLNGRPVVHVDQVKAGDALITLTSGGAIESKVESINKTDTP